MKIEHASPRDDVPGTFRAPVVDANLPPEGVHHPAGTSAGGVTGAVIGGLMGAVAGPVGAAVGAAAGAIAGANVGLNAAEAVKPEIPETATSEAPGDIVIMLSPPRDNLDTGGFSSAGQRQVLTSGEK